MPEGTIIGYKTNEDRYGKLQVQSYDSTSNDLTIRWTTYTKDSSAVYSSGSGLVIRGTYMADLDAGAETSTGAEFWWDQISETERQLVPQDSAVFAVLGQASTSGDTSDGSSGSMDIAYEDVTYDSVRNAALLDSAIEASDGNNMMPEGTIIAYQTDEGRYGKLQVQNFDSTSNDLTIRWTTYGSSSSTVYSSGSGLVIRGTYMADLDAGAEASTGADFWWDQISETERQLVPQNGAMFAVYGNSDGSSGGDGDLTNPYGVAYEDVTYDSLRNAALSDSAIEASDANNMMPEGTIIAYQTDEGRYGKLQVQDFDSTSNDLTIRWTTYGSSSSTVYSSGSGLVIRGTYMADLDAGAEASTGADFWWDQISEIERQLVPQNGAMFAVYGSSDGSSGGDGDLTNPYGVAYEDVTYDSVRNVGLSDSAIEASDANNMMPEGTIIAYQTDEGRYGKLQVQDFDSTSNDLTIRWTTYGSSSSTVYSSGSGLVIRGTYMADLDAGAEATTGADFWWDQISEIERQLVPQNGAMFTVYGSGGSEEDTSDSVEDQLPVAVDDSISVTPGVTTKINPLVNDTTKEGSELYIAYVTNGNEGTAEISKDRKAIFYSPVEGYTGSDEIDYYIGSTSTEGSVRASVHIEVTSELSDNAAPKIDLPLEISFLEDSSFTFDPAQVIEDPDDSLQALSISINLNSENLTSLRDSSGITLGATQDYYGSHKIGIRVTDPEGATAKDSAQITIVPVNDAPTADAAIASRTELSDGYEVSFADSSHDDKDPKGEIVEHVWSFGDGETSTAAEPTHTYDSQGTYTARLVVTDNNGASDTTSVEVDLTVTDIEANDLPDKFSLGSNYPNPFNPATQVSYDVPKKAEVKLEIFNTAGKRVATLVDGPKAAGSYTVRFDAANLPSGVYIYRMQAGNYKQTRKMTLIK